MPKEQPIRDLPGSIEESVQRHLDQKEEASRQEMERMAQLHASSRASRARKDAQTFQESQTANDEDALEDLHARLHREGMKIGQDQRHVVPLDPESQKTADAFLATRDDEDALSSFHAQLQQLGSKKETYKAPERSTPHQAGSRYQATVAADTFLQRMDEKEAREKAPTKQQIMDKHLSDLEMTIETISPGTTDLLLKKGVAGATKLKLLWRKFTAPKLTDGTTLSQAIKAWEDEMEGRLKRRKVAKSYDARVDEELSKEALRATQQVDEDYRSGRSEAPLDRLSSNWEERAFFSGAGAKAANLKLKREKKRAEDEDEVAWFDEGDKISRENQETSDAYDEVAESTEDEKEGLSRSYAEPLLEPETRAERKIRLLMEKEQEKDELRAGLEELGRRVRKTTPPPSIEDDRSLDTPAKKSWFSWFSSGE